jgi:hypothetical protein
MSAAFDNPLTAKARLSRSSRLGTHTRSIQAHFRAAQSSPPRPLWFCIAGMQSRSKHLSRCTRPLGIGFKAAPPPTTRLMRTTRRRGHAGTRDRPKVLPRGPSVTRLLSIGPGTPPRLRIRGGVFLCAPELAIYLRCRYFYGSCGTRPRSRLHCHDGLDGRFQG